MTTSGYIPSKACSGYYPKRRTGYGNVETMDGIDATDKNEVNS